MNECINKSIKFIYAGMDGWLNDLSVSNEKMKQCKKECLSIKVKGAWFHAYYSSLQYRGQHSKE